MSSFRKAAGIVLFNREGKVLICARKDQGGKHWQFPQGGIEPGESAQQAALRELFEETSVQSVRVVHTLKKPLRYYFPKAICESLAERGIISDGQNMFWSLFFFEGDDSEINLKTAVPEFKAWKWVKPDEAVAEIVFFKKRVYKKVVQTFKPLIEDFLKS